MNRLILITMGLFSFLFGSCSKRSPLPDAADPVQSEFRAGQVWEFKKPENQPNAKLTILRVESHEKLGNIVHIALTDVSLPGGGNVVGHLPFAELAVRQSVTKLERESGPLPDFEDGYRLWRESFDVGKAGVFTASVADAFGVVVKATPVSE